MKKLQYRHGDLLIEQVDSIPEKAKLRKSSIILNGEATGHSHKLNNGLVLDDEGTVFLDVKESATITHEEHNTIKLPPGKYIVIRQQEYDPYEKAVREVQD